MARSAANSKGNKGADYRYLSRFACLRFACCPCFKYDVSAIIIREYPISGVIFADGKCENLYLHHITDRIMFGLFLGFI